MGNHLNETIKYYHNIIDDIKDSGFHKGARLNGKNRYVDFNQGIDLRLLTKESRKNKKMIFVIWFSKISLPTGCIQST